MAAHGFQKEQISGWTPVTLPFNNTKASPERHSIGVIHILTALANTLCFYEMEPVKLYDFGGYSPKLYEGHWLDMKQWSGRLWAPSLLWIPILLGGEKNFKKLKL